MNRIKSLREEQGMTQSELGKLLGVKDAAISKYESEKVPLTAETILKLSEIFSVSADYILGRTMEKSEQGRKFYGRCNMERKLFVIGTGSITQAEYDELAGCPGTEHLSDEDAKSLLHHLCGFVKERIQICHSEPVYELSKHRNLYKAGERDRSPLYHSAGRNYILFDCACASYELKNSSLYMCTTDITEIQKGEEDGKKDTREGMRDVR